MRNKNSGFLIFVVAIISLIAGSALTALFVGKGGSSAGGGNVEEAVRQVLEENPDLIMNAFQKGRAKAQEEQAKKARENVAASRDKIEKSDKLPFVGNKDGDVVVAEFFDYSCGYCKRAFPDVMKLVEEDKNVKFVFIDFPILGPGSEIAARAALAVHLVKPEKYVDIHRELMEFQGQKTEETVMDLVKKAGLDVNVIKEKMKSSEVSAELQANRELGSEIGISGTPAFIVAGNLVPGAIPLDQMKGMVKDAREKK